MLLTSISCVPKASIAQWISSRSCRGSPFLWPIPAILWEAGVPVTPSVFPWCVASLPLTLTFCYFFSVFLFFILPKAKLVGEGRSDLVLVSGQETIMFSFPYIKPSPLPSVWYFSSRPGQRISVVLLFQTAHLTLLPRAVVSLSLSEVKLCSNFGRAAENKTGKQTSHISC